MTVTQEEIVAALEALSNQIRAQLTEAESYRLGARSAGLQQLLAEVEQEIAQLRTGRESGADTLAASVAEAIELGPPQPSSLP